MSKAVLSIKLEFKNSKARKEIPVKKLTKLSSILTTFGYKLGVACTEREILKDLDEIIVDVSVSESKNKNLLDV